MISWSTKLSLAQTDAAGVLFFGSLPPLVHAAYENLVVEEWGFCWNAWFQRKDWAAPIVHFEIEYHSPLFGGDLATITLGVIHVGTHSFKTKFHVTTKGDIASTGKMVHVFLDKNTGKKCPIPNEAILPLTEALSKGRALFPQPKKADDAPAGRE